MVFKSSFPTSKKTYGNLITKIILPKKDTQFIERTKLTRYSYLELKPVDFGESNSCALKYTA